MKNKKKECLNDSINQEHSYLQIHGHHWRTIEHTSWRLQVAH